MNIVLHEPEIPFNTGAIGRTCVATNTALHLIKPYGFILNDKNIKKAGMDYWPMLQLKEYLSGHSGILYKLHRAGRQAGFSSPLCLVRMIFAVLL